MKQITLTGDLRARLHGLTGPVQLCDADGYHLATIEPALAGDRKSTLVPYTEELCEVLGDIAEGVEFSDENGALVARIAPCRHGNTDSLTTTSQLDGLKRRRAADSPTYTTNEVLERMRNR